MASLSGVSVASSYTSLLKLDGNTDSTAAGNGSNAIQVKTGDNDATPLFLNTDRLGIGIQPSHELTVNNQIGIKRDGTDAFGTLTFDSSGLVLDQSVSGYSPLKIKSNGSEIARFTSTGLGIGTTSPSSLMHITSSSADGHLIVESTHALSSGVVDIRSVADRDSGIVFREGTTVKAQVLHDASEDSLVLTDGANSNTVFIKSNNVGIGTASPAELVEAEKDQNAHTVVQVDNNTAGTGASGGFKASADGADLYMRAFSSSFTTSGRNIQDAVQLLSVGASGGFVIASADATADMSFWTNNTQRLAIDGATGTVNQQGNYIVNEQGRQNHVANTMSSPYYRFDGTDDIITIADNDNLSFVTGGFTFTAWVYIEKKEYFSIFSKGSYNAQWEYTFNTTNDGKMNLFIGDNGTGFYTVKGTNVLSENKWHHLVASWDGVGFATSNFGFYLNGSTETIASASLSNSYNGMTNSTANVVIGKYGTQYAQGEIASVQMHNHVLDSTEVKELYSGASVPFKYKGANQTNLTSGTLVKGKAYRITTYNSNDDFTNLGASSNTAGVEFVSTGTTPTEWLHSSVLHPIGAVAEFDGSSAGSKVWGDKSGNSLDGTVSGATLENAPYDAGTEYEEGTFTPTIVSSGGVTLTAGSGNTAQYVRVGNKVTCNGFVIVNGLNSATTSHTISLHGLPYPGRSGNRTAVAFGNNEGMAMTDGDNMQGIIYDTNSTISLYVNDATGSNATNMLVSEWSDDGRTYFSVTYFT